jgi:hypothetical protein
MLETELTRPIRSSDIPELTKENAADILLEAVDRIEDVNVTLFREKLTPEWQKLFDGMGDDQRIKIAALDSLPAKQFDALFDLAANRQLGHMPGIHELGNLLTAMEGMRMSQSHHNKKAA